MNIKVIIASNGTVIPVEAEEQATNAQVINELVNSGQVSAPQPGHKYYFADKANQVEMETKTLSEMGFKDGDTITLLDKGEAASYYDTENDDADNDPGGYSDESRSGAGDGCDYDYDDDYDDYD